ncbi:TetR/AcrR family transcriptional regulator [Alteromonas sp.]|uniref:TetR/AcrR family transcriptional regulator n=1 Tax=Gammaproteobacteria TaxID=1236 RepID=UPI000C544B49|nr:TetR/AcrR family transcriptional regulator [Alteromonas sp.]MAI37157.1 TetR family transcriptional regulator [Alteromonas sp.]|tara:strand:- start:8742 stop:9308 length:567 start_codon:yes stop_codon:yes gene_type:complete
MEMRDQILTSAQRLVQQRGFNGFSYADIAVEVGIRKASLHHHFPTKTDLGLALIEVYSERLNSVLLNISGSSLTAVAKLNAYVALYRSSLEAERMCLGGMLASEALTLDATMLPSLKRFFNRNIEWLTEILTEGNLQQLFVLNSSATNHARMLLSALQGALLIARATGDREAFEQTASSLMTGLTRKG